jgi:hypothetical protein
MERTHEEATETLHARRESRILRRHLLDKEPISKLCDELGLQPTVFYRWQKVREQGCCLSAEGPAQPFSRARAGYLEKKIQTKGEVLASGVDGGARRAKKEIGEL